MKFEIENSTDSVRLKNWKDFIEFSHINKKTSNKILVFLTFNLVDEALNLLDYISKQKDDFDVLVIDNNSTGVNWDRLKDYCSQDRSVNLIRTSYNLGGGGGYAIGLEWVLERGYELVLITEDDARPAQDFLVDEMFKMANANFVTRIRYINENCASFSFHFTIYPIDLIKTIGVPDPTFFMIHDDLEYLKRQLNGMKKLGMRFDDIDTLGYYHPSYKAKNNIWTEYFSIRNGLYVIGLHSSIYRQIINLAMNLPYCWSRVFFDKSFSSLKIFHFAIFDFLFTKRSFKLNKLRLTWLRSIKVEKVIIQTSDFTVKIDGLEKFYGMLIFSSFVRKRIGQQFQLGKLFKLFINRNSIVASNYLSLSHPFLLLSKQVIFVESSSLIENIENYQGNNWVNKNNFVRVKFIFTMILTIINFILILPFILLKTMYLKFNLK